MKRNESTRPVQPKSIFDQAVDTLAKQENLTRVEAMRKIRKMQPAMFDAMQQAAPPRGSVLFQRLVAEDMKKGCTYEVAAQRAILKGAKIGTVDDWSKVGDREDSSGDDDTKDKFEGLVHRAMTAGRINRTKAMQLVARQHPDLVQKMRA